MSCSCMVITAPCFGCVPPPGLKASHCKKRQDWVPAKGRRNQRRACDMASPWTRTDYRGYYMTTCPSCQLNYLSPPSNPGCPACRAAR